jgi:hypothetical protein
VETGRAIGSRFRSPSVGAANKVVSVRAIQPTTARRQGVKLGKATMNKVQTPALEACLPYLVTILSGSSARQIAAAMKKEHHVVKLSPRIYVLSRGCVGSPAEAASPDTLTVAKRLAAQLPAATVDVCECDFYGRTTPRAMGLGPNLA